MAGSLTFHTVPPTSLPPCISFSLAGFQIFAPGGGLNAGPYFHDGMSYGPWFTAPAGATWRALLSLPAGAASGKEFCAPASPVATASATHAAAHANVIPIDLR